MSVELPSFVVGVSFDPPHPETETNSPQIVENKAVVVRVLEETEQRIASLKRKQGGLPKHPKISISRNKDQRNGKEACRA